MLNSVFPWKTHFPETFPDHFYPTQCSALCFHIQHRGMWYSDFIIKSVRRIVGKKIWRKKWKGKWGGSIIALSCLPWEELPGSTLVTVTMKKIFYIYIIRHSFERPPLCKVAVSSGEIYYNYLYSLHFTYVCTAFDLEELHYCKGIF